MLRVNIPPVQGSLAEIPTILRAPEPPMGFLEDPMNDWDGDVNDILTDLTPGEEQGPSPSKTGIKTWAFSLFGSSRAE